MNRWALVVAMWFSGSESIAAPAPGAEHVFAASLVGRLLGGYHYKPIRVDDTLSQAWLDRYIDTLDYSHMVFLASDIEEFQQWSTTLDDDIMSNQPVMAAATLIYSRYQERFEERVAAAQLVLSQPIDLQQDRSLTIDRSEAPFPSTAAEAQALWSLRVVGQVLEGDLQGTPREETVERLSKRYERRRKELMRADAADVLELYLGSLSSVFDPHSTYFKPATSDNFDIDISNSVEGIGARLRVVEEYTTIEELIPGGPAFTDGQLQVGDRIIAVAQGVEPAEDIVDLRIDRVVRLIRGPKGSEVRLTIIPVDAGDSSETTVITLIRDKVVLTESEAESSVIQIGEGDFAHDIGVVTIPSFYIDGAARAAGDPDFRRVSRDVARLLGEMSEIDGLVLDLRGNGGGSLGEAVAVTGLFIDGGPVCQVRDRDGDIDVLSDRDRGQLYDGPLVVLTDPLSASASEIVAGALQDYGLAVVVGAATTHGKGTVQNIFDLDRLIASMGSGIDDVRAGAMKVTIQKFYRVSGGSTQNRGVQSDIVLPSPWDGLDLYESDLDNALQWDEIEATRYQSSRLNTELSDELLTRSAARVAASEDFSELVAQLAERAEDSNRQTLSLNIDTRRALMGEEESEKDEDESQSETEDEEVEDDFILDEAVFIVNDWIQTQNN